MISSPMAVTLSWQLGENVWGNCPEGYVWRWVSYFV